MWLLESHQQVSPRVWAPSTGMQASTKISPPSPLSDVEAIEEISPPSPSSDDEARRAKSSLTLERR